MTIRETIITKLTSGKFIFTIITAIVFAYMSILGKLPTDKVMDVILLVLWAYFNKSKTETNGGTK